MEAYVHGVSTRKVDDLVRALGIDAGISKSEVSRICGELDAVRISLKWPRQSARNGHPGSGFWPPPRRPRQRPTRGVALIP
jgi:hypothetical protein